MKVKASSLVIAEWATTLRKVNMFIVSRYRIAMRAGAQFPPLIVDKDTKEVVSGNHRLSAHLAEFGGGVPIEVEYRKFKNHAERLKVFAEENCKHGLPMSGPTKAMLVSAMIENGLTVQEIAATFNMPVKSIESWAGQCAMVIGVGSRPVKHGFDTEENPSIKQEHYEDHMRHDVGVPFYQLVKQIVRWLSNGWVDLENEKNAEAIEELRSVI